MKGFLLVLCMCFLLGPGYAQGTSQVTSANISKISGNNYRLTINYMGNGMKHTSVTLFKGEISNQNLLSTDCISTPGNGSAIINFTSASYPNAILVPGLGNCGGPDRSDPLIISYNSGNTSSFPVIINSFNAKRDANEVVLNWSTLLETNAKEFIIQRNSGTGYTDVKKVTSSGKANGSDYTASDINTNKEISLYRVKIIAVNGTFSYSDTKTVQGLITTPSYTVYPNPAPANGKVLISDVASPAQVEIIDNMGRIKKMQVSGQNTIDLKNLPAGIYILRLHEGSNIIISRKLKIND